jgi:hypothetical protein
LDFLKFLGGVKKQAGGEFMGLEKKDYSLSSFGCDPFWVILSKAEMNPSGHIYFLFNLL